MLVRACLYVVVVCTVLAVVAPARLVVRELSHEWTVSPGEKYQGALELINSGAERIVVRIRQADYAFRADGLTEYSPPGSLDRSNADWISLAFTGVRLEIAPQSTVSVPYVITVPKRPALSGTYWSILLVDEVPQFASPVPEGEMGVRQALGYGVQLVTHIGDSGSRKLELVDTSVSEERGGLLLEVDLANPGQRWLRPVVWVEVHDSAGEYVGRFDSGRKRIYPGCSVRFRLSLPELERGAYRAALIADNLDEHVWAGEISFEVR